MTVLLPVLLLLSVPAPAAAGGYPRIANLWGIWPEGTDYDRYAKYGLIVSGGGTPQAWRKFRAEMRARQSEVLLLGTAPLMNIGSPESCPWMKDEWYVRRPNGDKLNWWAGQVYVPNLFVDDCLEALLQQTEKPYGELLREGTLDGVFYDSVVGGVTWIGEADTNRDGVPDVPAEVDPKWQQRQNLFLDRLRERYPRLLILANDVNSGHAKHVNGRLFEGGPLLDRVLTGSLAPADAIRALNGWMTDSLQPAITFAIITHPLGWQGWRIPKGDKLTTPGEVERVKRDFARMRAGLLTALITDAYYAYDFGTVWYGLPFWYAEYDAPLGRPKGPAREVFGVPPVPVLEWQAGRPTDALTLDGAAKATPRGIEADAPTVGGWQRLFATNPAQVPLEPGKTYRIEAECEVLRRPTTTFQFNVRTGKGGWEHHDKGIVHNAGEAESAWHIETTVTLDDYDDYAAEWHLLGSGGLRLKSLKITLTGLGYFRRDFEGGTALLNSTAHPLQVKLGRAVRRLKDDAAPRCAVEVDDSSPDCACQGAWEARDGEGHYYGPGYRLAAKPGDTARWSFAAPSSDAYTLFATVPGGKSLTDAAMYSVAGGAVTASVTLDQRRADGGWVRLFTVTLERGQRCEVVLRSGGRGATAADAIRAESAARYNDGATVQAVDLAPLDGIVLLNP